jgi:tetratricopeptide (TPR) repeat protein
MVTGATLRIGRAALRLALFCFLAAGVRAQSEEQANESRRANQLMAAGKYEQAIPIYQKLVQALPGNAGLIMNLALAERMAGRDREAIPHFEMVLKAQPKNRQAREMLAAAYMDVKRFEQAATQLRELTAMFPEDPHAWFGLGMSYQGVADAALERLQKADATSPYVAALVADTRVKRRQYRSAFFFYSEALKALPNLHGVHTARAEVYRKTGHPDWAAQEDAKEAALPELDCKAHSAECEFVAGHDLQLMSLPRGAAPTAEALYWQAKAANELALQAFFRLGQLPESVELHQLKADIARGQGQHLEAVKEWRAALALQPGSVPIQRELAISLFMAGDYASALEAAKKLLKSQPDSAEMNFMAGDSLLRAEQPEEAIPFLRAAQAADPKMLAADASLGLALSRIGKHAEAIPHLRKALELDDDGSLHFQLANAYRAAGDAEKARVVMAQYQEILKRNQEQKEEVAREAQIGPPK